MRILISGGHLTPAIAFIEQAQQLNPQVEIYFAGRKFSRQSQKQLSKEKVEVEKRHGHFIDFSSGKLGQGNLVNKLVNGLAVVRATLQALLLIPKYKPSVFVSFGGYLAVPLAIAAWFWRVPIVTHEQTRVAGIANKIIAKLANKVGVAYHETQKHFPNNKTTVVGNPIRQTVLQNNHKQPNWFTTSSKKPILYITGGSQGSEIINTTVAHSLRKILKDWIVIHQCGQPTAKRNYKRELEKRSRSLSKRKQSRYFVRPWVSETELAWIYSEATAMVSRAGANTTSEIAVRQIPAILIPLPFSHHNEQLINAKSLSDKGGAILLQQKDLDPQSLLTNLTTLLENTQEFKRNLGKLKYKHRDAAKNLYNLVAEYLTN